LLKDHVRQYTPEGAEKVSDIRAETLRRISREFGEAARIGSTIEIEGHHLPYRPVGVLYFKGSQAHRHCLLTAMALSLLPEIVGAADTPGSILGSNPVCEGHPETGRPSWGPLEGPDGLLIAGSWTGVPPSPLNEPVAPASVTLGELSPMGIGPTGHPFVMAEPEKFGLTYKPEVLIGMGSNVMMTFTNPADMEKALKAVSFTAYFSLYLDEVTELADLVLPETCYLERSDIPMGPILAGYANSAIIKEWSYYIRQPAIPPLYERRPKTDIMIEVVRRLGLWEDFAAAWNAHNKLEGNYALRPDRRYSYEEMIDLLVRDYFGEKHNLAWFKEHGFLKWKKKPEESYWKQFMPHLRIPLYFEWFLDYREKTEQIKAQLPYGHLIDVSDYQAVPDWKPCPSHLETQTEFDLFAFYYRVPIHTFGSTYNIAWLDDVSRIDPQIYNLTIHPEAARKKGVKEGDWVEVASQWGGKIQGRVHLTEGIRPDCLAMANCGGHWAKHLSIASQPGRGVCFEHLMKTDWDLVDWTVHNWDLCVKVKVTGISGPN
ncbi:MAG: molybdopterin-binding protein, partial [Candidatus Tectomicrobia bacterium]|nr:molybdopterin-binding protein [Candidatus Tectomicrobia bacterium]